MGRSSATSVRGPSGAASHTTAAPRWRPRTKRAAAGSTSGKNYAQAVCALVVVSGTYADQKEEVVRVLERGILPRLNPGESLFVIRIDVESYRKSNLTAGVTLDVRPSRANAQKLALAAQLDAFALKSEKTRHTDIRGAMMLGSEYLKENGAGTRTMVVLSDMQEDLGKESGPRAP